MKEIRRWASIFPKVEHEVKMALKALYMASNGAADGAPCKVFTVLIII